jgi:tetratricopeptide (TPR) repeat protein
LSKKSIDPKITARLLQVLGQELSDDSAGQDILARFKKAPKTNLQELTDYLKHRLEDTEFKEKLSAAQELPDELRTSISGGHVERLIQIASANTVNINPGIPLPIGLAAVIVGVIAVTILLISNLPKRTPPMSENGFNVAVAGFAMIDAKGEASSSEISRQFSDGLFATIENETKQLPPALQIELRGPKDVGIVANDDQASEIADHLKATILIYGRIEKDDQGFYQVEPRFFVKDQRTFSYGSEVTGPEYLGRPITGLTVGPNQQFDFNIKLNARSQALQSIFRGLAYFSIPNYEGAAVEFKDAVNTPHWDPDEGQEVAYLLLGTAKLRAWDLIQNPEPLDEAAEAFNKAYELDPDYVRNYLGLGAVVFAQAQTPNESKTGIGSVDRDKLVESINWYSGGLHQTQPLEAYIPAKAAFGLGQAYLLGFEFRVIEGSKELSLQYFRKVIEEYQTKQAPDLAWFAANAHAGLGRLAGHDEDWATMSDEYRLGAAMLRDMQTGGDPPLSDPLNLWIARFWSNAGFAEVKRNDLGRAQEYYTRAIEISSETVSKEERDQWQETLDLIKKRIP